MSDLRFQSFTNEDDEPGQYSGRIGDKPQISSDGTTTSGFRKNFLSFDFYQQYFDVDTDQVFSRILHSMNPLRGNFITESIQPLPDLYGPFWICVTLVFVTGIFGNIAQYIESEGAASIVGSDFRLVTGASSLVMSYVILVPAALYCLLWYRRVSLHYSYLEVLSAYGYSLAVFIPVSVLWTVDSNLFRWLLIAVAVVLSGTVLAKAFWSCLQADSNRMVFNSALFRVFQVAVGTVAGILFLHFVLAVCFKEYFFDAAHSGQKGAVQPPLPKVDLPKLPTTPIAGVLNNSAPSKAAAQVKEDAKVDKEKPVVTNEDVKKKGAENVDSVTKTPAPPNKASNAA